MGLVASESFQHGKLSSDGKYLLPSGVILYVRKESNLEIHSEIMEHCNNYTDSVSGSINAASTGFLKAIAIAGRLSDEYQHVRSISLRDKLQIGRTQLLYRTYSANMQPDFKLSESLIVRLKAVAGALAKKRTSLARYRADLIVRDYGTHVVTSVEAGGILQKVDFFQSDSVANSSSLRNKLSASMSALFHSLLGVSIGAGSVSKEDLQAYEKSVRDTIVKSYGGPNLGPQPKLSDWLRTLNENLVAIDRNGEPLCDVISEANLPGVNALQLLDLRKAIQSAIERYYKANTIVGCMDPGSSSFDPLANFPGDCEHQAKNYSFAGVYQMCNDNNPDAKFNLCADNSDSGAVKNPITGQFNCPSEYESVPLFKITGKKKRRCQKKTKRCWLIFHCNDGQECVESTSTLEAFWCAAELEEQLPAHSGMVYGGAYAADGRFVNEITKTASCSEFFRPYQIGRDIFLCLSLDLDLASEHRIPLGGFFSCSEGNPLAEPGREPVALARKAVANENDEDYPKRCPKGFSQVTLDTIDGCAVLQCVKSRPDPGRFPIRRPPFEDAEFETLEPSTETDQSEASRMALGVVGGVLGAVGVGGTAAYLVRRRGGDGSGAGGVVRRVRSQLARRFGSRGAEVHPGHDEDPETGCPSSEEPNEGDRQPLLLPDDGARCDAPPGQDATLQVRLMQAIRPR
ncbi:hypothetical protein BOX15_Mlig012544g2 [Macrostomum lignano]|uniref:MACPF domain-containing protein n=1 Tax=Macrostomum lignano TaxID=282301 RepID=A0A267EE03_9PLAT|nr:hypothetical protein BOX15_Mlig012544g2 [Macrostomum lignano]